MLVPTWAEKIANTEWNSIGDVQMACTPFERVNPRKHPTRFAHAYLCPQATTSGRRLWSRRRPVRRL